MAYPANERGIGGKFTRRTSARTPSTPYDRPPTALRGVRGGGQVAGERGGWMSKLLDPASRLIASGASKLFASMFRKRLTAPPLDSGISDKDLHPEVHVSRHASTHLLSETRNGDMHNGGYNVDNQTNGLHNGGSSVDNQKNSSGCDIVDLEQLLKQKTFTMVEFNHLEELLRSRTVESSSGNNDIGGDKKGKSVVLASDDIPGSSKVHKMFNSNGLASQSQIPMTEASSPAEVAKAYMVSRPNKEISLSGSLRDQAFHEGTKLRSMGSDLSGLNLSVAPRSVIRLSGVPEQHQYQNYAYQTTKLVGKSAMYRMSRSPYFKVNRAANTQIGEISRNDRSPVSSQWKSRGKQALKRGISALDDEYGSFGPIRRIRQKSNLVSPSRNNDSAASMQKSLYLEGRKYDNTSSENAEHETENSAMLPEQSSEKAHKLFQQLDKLLPSSPIKRPSELKATTIDESPSKLTLDMLHGKALKSTEDIGRSNFLSTHEVGKSAIASSQQNAVNSQSTRESTDEKSKLPQNHAYNGMNVKTPQANDVSKITLSSKNLTKPAPVIQKTPASSSVSVPKSKAPSFRISALEDSFDLDDDEDDNTNRLSVPSTLASTAKIPAQNGTCSKASSENPISSLVQSKKDEKDAIPPVLNKKENEFVFPVAANPSTQSQPPPTPCMPTPTPSMPTPRFNSQVARKETEQNPIPSPESKDAKPSTNDAGVKVGEELRSETTLSTGNSNNNSIAPNSANESTMVRSEVPKTDDAPKAPSAASESSTTSTPFFSFGASSSSSLSKGSINPSPNDNPLSSNSIIGNSTTTNSISNISSVSSAAATFSTTAPTPLFQQSDTETKSFTSSSFTPVLPSSAPSMTTTAASAFSSTPSTVFGFGAPTPLFQQSDTETKAFNSSNFTPVLPSSAPSMTTTAASASASPATSSAFSSSPSAVFGFGAPTQSTGSTVFSASNGSSNAASTTFASSSQNSKPIVFGATDNSSQNSKHNNSSQNSTIPITFGTVTFGSSNNSNNSSQNSSMTANISKPGSTTFGFGASDSNPQKPSAITFGASDNNPQKPTAFGFGASDNNPQKPSAITFGASDNNPQKPSAITFGATDNNPQKPSAITFGGSDNSPQKPSAITFGATDNNNNTPANNGSSSAFGTQSTQSSTTQFGLFSSSSFGNSAFGSSASSTPNPFTSNVFGSSASSSAPFQFGSSGSGSGSGFTFGSSAPGSGPTPTPFTFNSSSTTTPTFGFGANSPSNDQMSVEDTMTDATNQAPTPTPTFPAFGQPQNPTATAPSFTFGSPAPAFSFGGAQNSPVQQPPFQPGGGLDFNPGGSFSLGSGGGADKSGRKIIKVKRGARGRK